jgi:hypothetical protein
VHGVFIGEVREMRFCQNRRETHRKRRSTGERRARKLACGVCAVRRVVVSLLEAGGMRKEIPGLPVYLEVKAEGDKADWGSGAYSKAL